MTLDDVDNLTLYKRQWYINRLREQLKKENEKQAPSSTKGRLNRPNRRTGR